MKVVKLALLGTAALAAVSVSARADDLSDLKAQIESLNARLAAVESTPAVPAGFQLLSISATDSVIMPGFSSDKDFGTTGTRIGILPTADVPASTNIVWSGFARAAISYVDSGVQDNIDIKARAGLKVVGTTDTAVGEVGAAITLIADTAITGGNNRFQGGYTTDGYKGWWKITPELELSGGMFGSAAKANQGWDAKCSCYYTGTDGQFGTVQGNDAAQMRLTYASGPISFAIAVEDSDKGALLDGRDGFGVAGEFVYSGDTIGFDLNAGWWNTNGPDTDWTVNAGANFALGDIANLSLAAGMGEDRGTAGNGDRYWKITGFTSFSMSDAVTLEIGAGMKNYKGAGDFYAVGGGLYYTPVSQLTIGLEGSFAAIKNAPDTATAALVTVYRF